MILVFTCFSIFLQGRVGGRFLVRSKIKKPEEEQSQDLSLDSIFYTSQDLYVGSIITLNKHTFLLTSADEYVFTYMERPEEREKVSKEANSNDRL